MQRRTAILILHNGRSKLLQEPGVAWVAVLHEPSRAKQYRGFISGFWSHYLLRHYAVERRAV